jgi:hypothetical protein
MDNRKELGVRVNRCCFRFFRAGSSGILELNWASVAGDFSRIFLARELSRNL